MISPITPSLENADQERTFEVVIAYEAEFTHDAGQKYERITLDIGPLLRIPLSNNAWQLCYVEAAEIEDEDSNWVKIASASGICIFGKRLDGFYEVVVDESYIPWLLRHRFQFFDRFEFKLLFHYDPIRPLLAELDISGWGGFYARFLQNTCEALYDRSSQGLRLFLCSNAPPNLRTIIERAILNHEILTSDILVQRKFVFCLVFLALSLLDEYDPMALRLLEKREDEILQAFRQDPADLLKAASTKCPKRESQLNKLIRCLQVVIRNPGDSHHVIFDPDFTAMDNLNLYGSLAGITGSNHFERSKCLAMFNALLTSKAIHNSISLFDFAKMIGMLMELLPIGPQPVRPQTKIPFPLSFKPHILSTLYPLSALGTGVYELEKGSSDRGVVYGDVVKLQIGGVISGPTSQTPVADAIMCSPSALEKDRQTTLFVDYDGWYEDYQGMQQRLSDKVLRVVRGMKGGQKVLIVEEREGKNSREEEENGRGEITIWVVQVLQLLRICAGHLNFGQNAAFHRTVSREATMIKRCARQRLRKELEALSEL